MPNFDKKVEELETLQDKWLYVFKHLPSLQDRPAQLQERIFDRLFQVAEIAKLTKEERAAYVESMKYYRDQKNVTDTARGEGWKEGREEGKWIRDKEIVLNAHRLGRSVEDIAAFTGLSAERVREIVERGG